MPITYKTVTVEAAEDRVRKDTGTVTPGWPAYTYQEIEKYEGDPKLFVVEILKTPLFKENISKFNDFLSEAWNRKNRIDSRPGLDPVSKLVAKLAKETGMSIDDVRKKLNL